MIDDHGYRALRDAIVSGDLLPSERLVEENLSRRLGIGRAAVRMALVRLEHDGLVEHERHRGARVRRVSEEEAVEILERGDLMAVSDANAALHRRILEISGHETARRLSGTLMSQIVRFQYRTVLLPGRSDRSLREHTAIVQAIAAANGDMAERAMRRHLSQVADALRARAATEGEARGSA